MSSKLEKSDKPEISQECESICYGKKLLTKIADFALHLEITRNLNLFSIYIQSVVTTRDLVESGWHTSTLGGKVGKIRQFCNVRILGAYFNFYLELATKHPCRIR